MTTQVAADDLVALRAELVAAEREWDRIDAQGDTAATVRVREVIVPRIRQLRRAIAVVNNNSSEVHR